MYQTPTLSVLTTLGNAYFRGDDWKSKGVKKFAQGMRTIWNSNMGSVD